MLSFKANYGQDLRIEFKRRKKRKYKGAERFIKKNKKNTRGSQSSTRKSTRRDKEIC